MGVLQLSLFLILGYISQYILPKHTHEVIALVLNKFVIYISLPALVVVYMTDMKFDIAFLLPVFSIWVVFAFSMILILILSRIFGWSRSLTGAMLMVAPLGNTSFLGIPFTKVFFSELGIPYAIVCDQLGTFLILSTVGIVILSIYGSSRISIYRIGVKVLTFPAFVALVFTLFVSGDMIPDMAMSILELFAFLLTPVALVSIGLFLKLRLERSSLVPMSVALSLKLVVTPLVLLGVFYAFGLDSLSARVTVFEVGMAPMISSSMLAISAGLQKRFVASTLGYGILASFMSVPILYQIIQFVL